MIVKTDKRHVQKKEWVAIENYYSCQDHQNILVKSLNTEAIKYILHFVFN